MPVMSAQARIGALVGELRNPPFRRLWLSQLVSEIGDWAARLALATVVFYRTDSAAWAALIVVSALLPTLGPGQLLATLADRMDRRVVMVSADLARAAVFAALAAATTLPIVIVFALSVVAGLATVPFEAARSAATLDVTPTDRVAAVLSLGQVTQSLALVVGWTLGGVLLATVDANRALAINSCTFLISAVLLLGMPALRPEEPAADGEDTPARVSAIGRLRFAATAIAADPLVRRAAMVAIMAVGPGTAVEALVVPHVALNWPTQPSIAAVLLAAGSAGELILTVAIRSDLPPDRLVRVASYCAVVPAIIACLLFLTGRPDLQSVGFIASALTLTAIAPASAALGPRLPVAYRASCFAVLGTALTATQVVLAAAGGLLADATSPAMAAASLVVFPVVAGLLSLVRPFPAPLLYPESVS
jgi:hypothetical protein